MSAMLQILLPRGAGGQRLAGEHRGTRAVRANAAYPHVGRSGMIEHDSVRGKAGTNEAGTNEAPRRSQIWAQLPALPRGG